MIFFETKIQHQRIEGILLIFNNDLLNIRMFQKVISLPFLRLHDRSANKYYHQLTCFFNEEDNCFMELERNIFGQIILC
jgi:hypothetical protein